MLSIVVIGVDVLALIKEEREYIYLEDVLYNRGL